MRSLQEACASIQHVRHPEVLGAAPGVAVGDATLVHPLGLQAAALLVVESGERQEDLGTLLGGHGVLLADRERTVRCGLRRCRAAVVLLASPLALVESCKPRASRTILELEQREMLGAYGC